MCNPAAMPSDLHPAGALVEQRRQGGKRAVVGDEHQHPLGGQDRHPLDHQLRGRGVEGDRRADHDHRVADGIQLGCLARADHVVDRERSRPSRSAVRLIASGGPASTHHHALVSWSASSWSAICSIETLLRDGPAAAPHLRAGGAALDPDAVRLLRWSSPVPLGSPQTRRTDPAEQLPGVDRHGPGVDQHLVALAGNVVVVVVEAAFRDAVGRREVVQFLVASSR